MKQREAEERSKFLRQDGAAVQTSCQEKVTTATSDVEKRLAVAIQDMESRLPGLVKDFHEENFSPDELHAYQQKLCEFIDERMSQMLEVMSGSLGKIHDEAKNHIIGECTGSGGHKVQEVRGGYRVRRRRV